MEIKKVKQLKIASFYSEFGVLRINEVNPQAYKKTSQLKIASFYSEFKAQRIYEDDLLNNNSKSETLRSNISFPVYSNKNGNKKGKAIESCQLLLGIRRVKKQ